LCSESAITRHPGFIGGIPDYANMPPPCFLEGANVFHIMKRRFHPEEDEAHEGKNFTFVLFVV